MVYVANALMGRLLLMGFEVLWTVSSREMGAPITTTSVEVCAKRCISKRITKSSRRATANPESINKRGNLVFVLFLICHPRKLGLEDTAGRSSILKIAMTVSSPNEWITSIRSCK